MLLGLKLALVRKGIRQTRMAVELGWDPAKLSRIVNELLLPTSQDRGAIAAYLQLSEAELFDSESPADLIDKSTSPGVTVQTNVREDDSPVFLIAEKCQCRTCRSQD